LEVKLKVEIGPPNAGKIAVLVTCFNRRDVTVRGLVALRAAAVAVDDAVSVDYSVYLVDDGSTDGTGEPVAVDFAEVYLIKGSGSLFWNGGMRTAWVTAIPDAPDYYLWWNDDIEFLPHTIVNLLASQHAKEAEHGPKVISVGKVLDPDSDAVTYGGYRIARGLSRLRFVRVPNERQPCDTMNGNCVLIPARAVKEVGIHSEHFTHGSGDVDYGLRACKAGYLLFQTPFPVGYTAFNEAFHANTSRLTSKNWRFIFSDPKGLPVREWMHFCRAHAGPLWPINFLVRYLKIMRPGA